MFPYYRNPYIQSEILPVEIVFHPSWWYRHAGICFDEDFFFHPLRRVEAERRMQEELYQRFGKYGLGENRGKDLPVIGAIHNAAGYLLSQMLGCKVNYRADAAPQVVPADREDLDVDPETAFKSEAFQRMVRLQEALQAKFGYLVGDINWSGILNIALDLVGQNLFLNLFSKPQEIQRQFWMLAGIVQKFVASIAGQTGSSSISVNRLVRKMALPVFLHSECSHTMISTQHYEKFLMPIDLEWSRKYRPFGIHYCGKDPHRFAESFCKIANLDFLDVGWGGNIKVLREKLPHTFLNLRLDAVAINQYSENDLAAVITRLVEYSNNPFLTGVCCINMDDRTDDRKIELIFRVVQSLRTRYLDCQPIH